MQFGTHALCVDINDNFRELITRVLMIICNFWEETGKIAMPDACHIVRVNCARTTDVLHRFEHLKPAGVSGIFFFDRIKKKLFFKNIFYTKNSRLNVFFTTQKVLKKKQIFLTLIVFLHFSTLKIYIKKKKQKTFVHSN